jgi:hypothetical protein
VTRVAARSNLCDKRPRQSHRFERTDRFSSHWSIAMTDFGAPAGTFPPPPVPPPPPSPGGRTGPPWEQPGPAVQRFIDTAKGVLLEAEKAFSTMRREGGLANPIVYYLIGGLISVLAQAIWNGIGLNPGYGMGPYAGAGIFSSLILGACIVILGIFIWSGIVHVMLMLLGGQNFPFETTLRTIAYAHGSAAPIGAAPFCGGLIAGLWGLYAVIIGLSKMQEISTGKAAGAVLIPVLVCCVLAFIFAGFIAAALGMAALSRS